MSKTAPWRRTLPRTSSHTVLRPRVHTLLGRNQPLTLLAAPHGYGKSVAIAAWLDGFDDDDLVCCLDVTPGTDAATVWQRMHRGLSGEQVSAVEAYDAVSRWLGTGDEPVVVAIDSLQHLPDEGLLVDLASLLRRSSRLHAIVATRRLPDSLVDIAQIVDTVVMDQRELALCAADSRALFSSHGLAVDTDLSDVLHEAVDGWPVLVHRGVLTVAEGHRVDPAAPLTDLVEAAITGLRRHLNETILPDLLPPELRDLAERCALVGEVDSHSVRLLPDDPADGPACERELHELARSGVVIERGLLDRVTWSMPTPSAAALREQHQLSRDRTQALHRRFLEHHCDAEDWPRALCAGLALDDAAALTSIIGRAWPFLMTNHDALLREAFERIPDEVLATNPTASSAKGLLLKDRSRSQEDVLPDDPDQLAGLAERDDVVGLLFEQLTIMLADRSGGRLDGAVAGSRKLLRLVELADRARPGSVDEIAGAIHSQSGVTAQVVGDLSGAAEHFTRALTVADHDPSGTTLRSALGGLAMIEALQGRMHVSRSWVEKAAEHPPYEGWLGRRLLTPRLIAEAWGALEALDKAALDPVIGMLAALEDDDLLWGHVVLLRSMHDVVFEDSWSAIDRLTALRRRRGAMTPPGSYADLAMTFALADHQLVLGQGTRALQTLAGTPAEHPANVVRRALISLLSGDPEVTLAQTVAGQRLSVRRRAHLDLLGALAHLDLGDLAAARPLAATSLQLMTTYGLRTPLRFVPTAGVVRLLEQVDLSEEHRALLKEAIDVVPSPLPATIEVVTLTEREQAVLHGLTLGLSAQQMAAADYVSVNTIKSQARTLYRKLGASNRSEALRQAGELGLLVEPHQKNGDRGH